MPGGRRLPRTVRSTVTSSLQLIPGEIASNRYSPLGVAVPTLPGLEHPTTPKHFPFPNTPIDTELMFETFMYCFTMMAVGLQYLHIYRTVWWLPHSYTKQAINFHLIDLNLVVFIAVVLSRRIIYLLGCALLDKVVTEKLQDFSHGCCRLFLFGMMSVILTWSAYRVIQNHPVMNICYLCYPVIVYIILFGLTLTPFFELISWSKEEKPPLHACTSNAGEIRQEVENLKTNFNNRVKQILFSSVFNACYAGFIPCCFVQNFLYYDVYWASQHVILIYLSCFTSYANHVLPLRYCDVLHRSALHLGSWDKVETRSVLPVAYSWQEDMLWPNGALVRHGREMYRAQGETNAAEPGNQTFMRFYNIFKNPSHALSGLLILQMLLVMYQLTLLIRSTYWYHIISLGFLLFYNHYTLFKIFRDYLISVRIYKAEQELHEKVNGH